MNEDAEPKRESQLTAAINRLEKLVDEHGSLQQAIAQRLNSVLMPTVPQPVAGEKNPVDRVEEPPAVRRLNLIIQHLLEIEAEYEDLKRRIEA